MIRVRRTRAAGFTQIPNDVLRDPTLSLKARGLLVFLLSHEDGFHLSVASCVAGCRDSRKAVRTAFDELETAGYAKRTRRQGKTGRWIWDIEVSDQRDLGTPSTPFPSMDSGHIRTEEPNNQKKLLTPPPAAGVKKMGKANPCFEALVDLHHGPVNARAGEHRIITRSLAGAIGTALRDIREVTPDVTPEEIRQRAANYTRLPWNREHSKPSAMALAKWWSDCDMPVPAGPTRERRLEELSDEEIEEAMRGVP